MEVTVPIDDMLKRVDLAWWPEFLLHNARDQREVDSFTLSLYNLALALVKTNRWLSHPHNHRL